MRWGGWNLALLAEATGANSAAGDPLLLNLKQEMAKPLPNRQRVVELAREFRKPLAIQASRLASQPLGRGDLLAAMRRVTAPRATNNPSWDVAAQRFLALAAVHYSSVASSGWQRSPEGTTAAYRRQSLVTLRDLLQFEATTEGPYNSPRDWTVERRQAIGEQLEAIHQSATQP